MNLANKFFIPLLLVVLEVSEKCSVIGAEIRQKLEHLERQERRFLSAQDYPNNNVADVGLYERTEIDIDYARDKDGEPEVEFVQRDPVPHLLPNFTKPTEPPAQEVDCGVAHVRCANRAGCGLTLQNYMYSCSLLIEGKSRVCNNQCRYSLIALMSTHEGQRLMECDCRNDTFCKKVKNNMAECRNEVVSATKEDTVVSCTAAQWICSADPMCSTALNYYNNNCGAMFRGHKCSERCLNSINILKKQSKAKKLESCFCEGTEPYDCKAIKANMEILCFPPEIDTNEINNEADRGSSSFIQKVNKVLLLVSLVLSALASVIVDSFQKAVGINNDFLA